MSRRFSLNETLLLVCILASSGLVVEGWVVNSAAAITATSPRVNSVISPRYFSQVVSRKNTAIFSSKDKDDKVDDNDDVVERTSFDQAGRSLIEAEDQKRMEQMGDFDSNSGYQDDSAERMRAAIRERALKMGVEKSKVSADYIAQKQEAAKAAGPGARDPSMFAGLDLSKISDTKLKEGASDWNDQMPTMFYDPETEMSKEEQEEADPLMTKSITEQYLYEITQTKWPTPLAAIREVVLMAVVIAATAVLVIGWDNFLRGLYTGVGLIPTKEDLANYASRFDGLDLPDGWMDNMNDVDVQQFTDKVGDAVVDSAISTTSSNSFLPDL